MNLDKIKSNLTTSFAVFISEFGDVTSIDKKQLEEKCGLKIDNLFKKQIYADKSKKKLGEADFKKALAIYLNRFLTSDGLDAEFLAKDLEANGPTIKLHFKKDAVRFLKLLSQIGVAVQGPKRGLL